MMEQTDLEKQMNAAALATYKQKSQSHGHLLPAIPPLPVRRFTVDEYHKLAEIGVLTENDRVELIHGWIVPKKTINPPHSYAVTALMEQFLALNAPGTVRVQQPITTSDSEPEPDLVFVTGMKSDYKTRQPRPAECSIVIEVAEATLHEDQTTKLELSAGAKVAVYWIVNLIDRRVEVYTQPKGGKKPTYKKRTDYGPGEAVPVVFSGKKLGTIAVKELLP